MLLTEDELRAIHNRKTLFAALENLGWPISAQDTYTYPYNGPALSENLAPHVVVSQIPPFGGDDPFAFILAEFQTAFRRGDLREILKAIRADIRTRAAYGNKPLDKIIFVCATENYEGVRFVRFEQQEGGRQPTLRVFGWERGQRDGMRTLRHVNMEALRLTRNLLDEPDWQDAAPRWHEAWSVEKVTQDFYDDYDDVFKKVEAGITGNVGSRRLFTQRLFNRLMFIRFLQKKGWLRYQGNPDFVRALYTAATKANENFYRDRLHWLFFFGLGSRIDNSDTYALAEARAKRGDVPFLNGGLFEMESDGSDNQDAVSISNAAFTDIFALFEKYNFTITESAPDDVDVAVDPEMLGRVFERLVTGRHESGSYYTPRPVVANMCRESLKKYLAHTCPLETAQSIDAFVERRDARELRNPEAIMDALRRVRVCDPACGSGAYLLGMMQELLALRQCLFSSNVKDYATIYERKLEIIQRNLYGADKDLFAVNIAMLRLWLSLVIDDRRDPLDETLPEKKRDVSLPNLKFKIQYGDSLTAPDPSRLNLYGDAYREDASRLAALHDEYFEAHDIGISDQRPKALIEDDIQHMEVEIDALFGSEASDKSKENEVSQGEISGATAIIEQFTPVPPVRWHVTFAEVFASRSAATVNGGGFDIVLANPPYVRADPQFKHIKNEQARQQEIMRYKKYRDQLAKSNAYTTINQKWDLYIPFLERAYQMLRPDGHMVFIIPDAYNANKYADRSHDFFLKMSHVVRIDFCSEIDLFDAKINNTIVFFTKTTPDEKCAPVRIRRWGKDRSDFETNAQVLPTMPQQEFGSSLFRADGARIEQAAHGTVPLGEICFINVGMGIHSDEKKAAGLFRAKDMIANSPDGVPRVPFVENKDVGRWVLKRHRFVEYGTDRAPRLFRQRTFPELYTVTEKLIAVDIAVVKMSVAYDDAQTYYNHSSYGFVLWHSLQGVRNASIKMKAKYRDEYKPREVRPDLTREDLEKLSQQYSLKYLLGIMNSEFARNWLSTKRRNKMHVYPDDWKPLPIASATLEQQAVIITLVQKCLDAKGVGCEAWEQEINEQVAALYGL